MRSFFSPERCWPRGHRRVHAYVMPSGAGDLAEAMRRTETALDRFSHAGLNPVPAQWRHLTVASTPIPDADRDACIRHLRDQLRRVEVFDLLVGSAMATSSTVLMPAVSPNRGWGRLADACVRALSAATGHVHAPHEPPHLALAYATNATTADAGRVTSQLWRDVPAVSHLRVRDVIVADVTQDVTAGVYRWDELARIALPG